ncbi:MAG: prolyl oligopeptidase family serine peptidase [Bacteroidales bacterium]|nr:prolyl oligopeptidase family serine peptidase [Bacteroidales bacterium]
MVKRIFSIVAALILPLLSFSQTKPLDHSVYDGWQRVGNAVLSPDGSILSYSVLPQEGDALLIIRKTDSSKEVSIPRGTGLSLDPTGKWAYCKVVAPFADTRQARIAKKKREDMPKDSLAFINLSTFEVTKVPDVKTIKTGFDTMPYVAYSFDKGVVSLNPATRAVDTIKHADNFLFNRDASLMAVTLKKDKKDSLSRDALIIYNPATKEVTTLSEGKKYYGGLEFSPSGKDLLFLSSTDSLQDGNKHCALNLWRDGRVSEIVPQGYTVRNTPKGWTLTENSAPYFSTSGERIFVGVAPFRPAKDTTIVDFEAAQVDIWNWDAMRTPPQQKVQQSRILSKTYPAVINLPSREVIPLTTSEYARVALWGGADGDWALSIDSTPYAISSTWDGNNFTDVEIVSLKDGSHRRIMTKLSGSPSVSPTGKYLVWYDSEDLQFYTYEVATGATVCLTADQRTAFYDEEDDHPTSPGPYDSPSWIANDEYLLICDRYDVFRFKPDGSEVVNITKGVGRQNRVQFRRTSAVDWGIHTSESRVGIRHQTAKDEQIMLTAFNEVTKENGLGFLQGIAPQEPKYFADKNYYSGMVKARNKAVMAYLKGNFRAPYDIYLTKEASRKGVVANAFKNDLPGYIAKGEKLSSINPQQANYRWGEPRLVHWNAYDGTPLDGILYVPDGTTDADKLPLMIYFYEKNAETLYRYIAPAPSRSTVNIPYFVSNGYAVFVPDIVYEVGHPGESAYNCIVSGAEALCDQFRFINRDKMAIQGQSWGGYQVAYLVTRTDLFAAAGAGAPVGNMTSAYGGIRWESGNVRAVQYEHGQSRIGKSMWEEGGLDLYIENSPVFHVDKVTTPVLIMHNDADGAVPWYQGIEFFMNLRRFGKQAWMLEYNNEAHNLSERRNSRDLSVRLQQFFDYYLKDGPLPAWMKTGVPVWQKGQYYGFEEAE